MLVKLFACKAAWLKTSRAKEPGLRQLLQIVLHQGLPDNDTVAVYKTARQVQKGDHYKVNNNHIKLRKQTNKQTNKQKRIEQNNIKHRRTFNAYLVSLQSCNATQILHHDFQYPSNLVRIQVPRNDLKETCYKFDKRATSTGSSHW